MFDPGFDWMDVIKQERVVRLPAACLLEEAGRLLLRAQAHWPGRVRGGELRSLGNKLTQHGFLWRVSAMGWADSPLANGRETHESAGPLLSAFITKRRYEHGKEPPPKDEEAARLLVRGAFLLTYAALPLIERSGDHLYRDKEAMEIEDWLELPEEAPYAALKGDAVPEEARRALGSAAIANQCACLAATLALIRNYQGGILTKNRPKQLKEAAKKWYKASERWTNLADSLTAEFAALAPTGSAAALTSSVNRHIPYGEGRDHYTSEVVVARAETVACDLAMAIWQMVTPRGPVNLADPPGLGVVASPLLGP